MKTFNTLVAILLLFCMSIFTASNLTAQSSAGKLAGKIFDTDTKEPLIGANIVIEGTSLGASTGIDGDYFILNIEPGAYTVRVTYIGYQTKEIREVRVVAGITKELSIDLKLSTVELTAVTIEAQKVFFEAKATNTVKVVDSDELSAMPVRGVERALSLQAGVVSSEGSGGVAGNATINVRGGRGGEVLYVIDGVPQNDPLFSANNSQISQNAVEQVSFQVGGFEAKYGQAGSGVVNLTTKTGGANYIFGGEIITSTFTDNYGYNLYNLNISGPIIPNQSKHTFFISGERGWNADGTPSAQKLSFNSDAVFSRNELPNNESSIWRWTIKTTHDLGNGKSLWLSANINDQKDRTYVHRYAKWNSEHNSRNIQSNTSLAARFSYPISKISVLNINAGYRLYESRSGDGVWLDEPLTHWGDTTYNKSLLAQGLRPDVDDVGIFYLNGRVNNFFTKQKTNTYSVDADFTTQLSNHMVEFGGGLQRHTLRYYTISPVALAIDKDDKSEETRFRDLLPFYFGYDVTGQKETSDGQRDTLGSVVKTEPKVPLSLYAFIQDRYELSDLVINIGLRFDYFNSYGDKLRNELLPFAYGNPQAYDDEDFVKADPEVYFSPRIGLGFPVTETTVFHAQYGVFIQQPQLIDLYVCPTNLEGLISDNNFGVNTGHLQSERTTQYELGFRQIIGDNKAAVNITAFNKNTRGLVNQQVRWFQRTVGGQFLRYYGPANADFGTIRGVATTLDVARISYVTISVNYTYESAEGTGSSTNSSYVAAFRNTTGEIPVVIAPLDFDQRHTATINASFTTYKGELGALENTSLNIVAMYNSGRPYTPVESQDLIAGVTNFGSTKGYVNSAYGPGSFLINLKLERSFEIKNMKITPYLWIENLLDTKNAVQVYRSTGDPNTTGWINSSDGKAVSAAQNNPAYYIADYKSFEQDPTYFGIPRQIRLGLRMNYGK